mmetsp:Transcript_120370/g.236588  ORF Transcript_120370/g.236588 Transcript_120370/m.236588 type:complete len:175 (-) Transcript_120370:77-601(-)
MAESEAYPKREVAESTVFFLQAEMARSLRDRCGLDAATAKLDAIGFSAGVNLATRQSALRFPCISLLDAMKYLCKDMWPVMFRKPVDRLQVDKAGNYVIQDKSFRWLEPFTGAGRDDEVMEAAILHVALPVGFIRGILHALRVECTVNADLSVANFPACHFKVALKAEDGQNFS